MPHTGGAYSFARTAIGPWGGFITGLAETITYVATTAVIVFFSASYADGIASTLIGVSLPMWAWWIILYVVFIALNAAGSHTAFRFAVIVAIISLAIIVIFSLMAAFSGLFSVDKLFNIAPEPGQTAFLPFGVEGILWAIPFAVWFFLGIEELPLAAEEAKNPARDIPKAGLWARTTLIATGLLILFLNTGINGAEELRVAGEPLLDGFRLMVGDQLAALLGLIALIGLLASLQGIMFAYARNMFSLSRAGYYPRGLSVTNGKNVPFVALVVGAVIGFAALLSIEILTAVDAEGAGAVAGAIVLNIAVWGAMLAYMMQAVSFLILRKKLPNLKRPYVSPWGVPGAWAAAIIAGISFVGYLINPAFQTAIAGIAVIYLVMLFIFAVYGRHNLVLAPEEEYAVKNSKN
jgi:ethanolamine permease